MSRIRRGRKAACIAGLLALALASAADALQLVPRNTPVLTYPEGETATVDVRVQIVVGIDGEVEAAEVVQRQPADAAEVFDEAALEFARELRFEPMELDGKPSRVQSEIALHFAPPEPPPPPEPEEKDSPRPEPERTPPPAALPMPDASFEAAVRGTRAPVSASDLHIHVGQLADVPRRTASQMLSLAPGMFVSNHGGEGHATAVFLRGFDAREGQDIEFRLDGIPLNEVSNAHGHGYTDTHFIIPELVDEIRVVEGPFDPRQGDFAVAGSAEYHLGLHQRGTQVKTEGGSYGWRRLALLWGPEGEEDGTFTGLDFRQGDGFGLNRSHASASMMGQYESRLDSRTRVSVLGFGHMGRFDSAGVIREDDYRARNLPCERDADSQFFCTYDPNQGGASSRFGVSTRLSRRGQRASTDHQLFVTTRQLRLRENLTGYLLDVSPPGGVQRGDGIEQSYNAHTVGLQGSYQKKRPLFGRRQELELGYFLRHDMGETAGRRLRWPGGEPYLRVFDNAFRISNLGGYAAGSLRLSRRFSVRGGLRLDAFAFAVTDRNQPQVDRSGQRETSTHAEAFGLAIQPRLSTQLRLGRGFDWVSGFGVGTRSSDAVSLSDGEFAPFARVSAVETGLLFERTGGEGTGRWNVMARSVVFHTRVDRDLLFEPETGRTAFAGRSNRFGAMALSRVNLGTWLDVQGSTTWAEAFLPGENAPWYAIADGERLPYIPRWVSRLDASVRRKAIVRGEEFGWSVGLGTSHIGRRPLPLGQLSQQIFTVDAAARVRWKALEFGLAAQNLLDARYRQAEFNYASNFRDPDLPASLRSTRHFVAGEPRMVFATLTWHPGGSHERGHDHDVHSEEELFP